MTAHQQFALDMVLDVAAWLNGTEEAAGTSEQPDAIIKHACEEGARRLASVKEYLEGGETPMWYLEGADDADIVSRSSQLDADDEVDVLV